MRTSKIFVATWWELLEEEVEADEPSLASLPIGCEYRYDPNE